MSSSRPSPRLRRLAASSGALALAGTLALSGVAGGGVEMTEAAWSDTEVAQATIKASWMEGFTRVTDPGWKMQNVRNTGGLPDSIGMDGPAEEKRNFGLIYPAASPPITGFETADGNNRNKASFGSGADESIVPPRDVSDDLWMGRFPSGALNGGTDVARAGYCMSYPSPATIGATTSSCGGNAIPTSRLYAAQNSVGFTYSITASNLGSKIARVNAQGFTSSAQCNSDGTSSASISHSSGVLQLARETTSLNYSFDDEVDIMSLIPVTDNSSILDDGTTTLWGRYNVEGLGSGNSSFVLAVNVRKNTYATPYYALAEMDLIVQVYSAGGGLSTAGTYIDQINLPLTRSECGFSNGNQPLPAMRGTFRDDTNQLGWPLQALTTLPATSSRFTTFTVTQLVGRGVSGRTTISDVEEKGTSAAELPTTTVTSPLETTISAPPNPSGKDESPTAGTSTAAATTTTRRTTTVTSTMPAASAPTVSTAPTSPTTTPATQVTTSTSAAPASVIPDEPPPLSPGARLEDVGTATVGGDDLVVVVEGTSVPTDAQQGLAALEIWLGGGDPGDDWETFASTDPDADGWRWAAINQESGTVVYIR